MKTILFLIIWTIIETHTVPCYKPYVYDVVFQRRIPNPENLNTIHCEEKDTTYHVSRWLTTDEKDELLNSIEWTQRDMGYNYPQYLEIIDVRIDSTVVVKY